MRCLTLLLALVFADAATAGVVSRDLFEPGDGLLTYDDVNQREWLDFSVMMGQSSEFVGERIGVGGRLFGFHLATANDVGALARSLDAPWSRVYSQDSSPQLFEIPSASLQPVAMADELLDLLAVPPRIISTPKAQRLVVGHLASDGTVDSLFFKRLAIAAEQSEGIESGETVLSFFLLDAGLIHFRQESSYWLYRDAVAVPEPTTACLTLAACLAAWRLRGLA